MASAEMTVDVNLLVDEIKVVSIQPGDKLVIHVDHSLSQAQIVKMRNDVSAWTDVPVLILDNGARLDVLRKEES